MIIEPSFITEEGEFWSGTNYIVGGSYEDKWGFGLYIQTICQKFAPSILENFLPLYSFFDAPRNMFFTKLNSLISICFILMSHQNMKLK